MNEEIYLGIAGFGLTILVTIGGVIWSFAKIKEQLGDEIQNSEKRILQRISDVEKHQIRLEATADLNKERIERIQGIFELKLSNLEEINKLLERRIAALRAEIDKRLTLRKPNS